tara:strand:+ start:155 stop:859 length:705 start_codon:yes stop_codon:yes gene_type:complete
MPKPIDYDSPAVMAEARRKLAEMYAAEDTAGRTRLGRSLGYSGKPENIRRSIRRLARARLGEGQKENLNAYFKDYVTYDDPDPRRHDRIPPYSIQGNAQIHAFVMMVAEDRGTYTSFIYTGGSNSIRVLFDEFADEVISRFSDEERYLGLDAIAFTPAGIAALVNRWGVVPPREPEHNYGITLHNTRFAYVDKKRQDMTPPTITGRQFPKRRRKDMIQFINRSYGQRNRGGVVT